MKFIYILKGQSKDFKKMEVIREPVRNGLFSFWSWGLCQAFWLSNIKMMQPEWIFLISKIELINWEQNNFLVDVCKRLQKRQDSFNKISPNMEWDPCSPSNHHCGLWLYIVCTPRGPNGEDKQNLFSFLEFPYLDILSPSVNSGHADQDGSDNSMVPGQQQCHRCSPDPRFHVALGGTMGTWTST